MGVQKGQAVHPPLVVTNKGDVSWRGPGRRYPLKEKRRTQWGRYGRQYGTGGERKGNQTDRTDRTPTQSRNTAYEPQRQGSCFPTKSTGNGQGGNRGDEDRNDKKKYRDTGISFENDSHEESDTEDSYEFEITPQQLSQVTPGGGALKIKLSKKKPLKITAGAPDRQSETIPMELERTRSSKQSVLSSHIDTSSESTQPKRGAGAPLFITPIHLENNVKPQKGTSIKREDDLKGSTNHRLARERVTQVQGKETQGSQGPGRVNNPPGNGGGGDSSGGTKIKDFQLKEGVLPEEVVIKEEGEVMMVLTLVMMGMGMIFPPLQTPLSQRKENRKDLNMFMYSKDLLVQKVKKVNLEKQEEMVEMGRISP